MISLLGEYLRDFTYFIYPSVCVGCGKVLSRNENVFCTYCVHELSKTDFHLHRENAFYKRMWGRLEIQHALSFLYHEKGNKTQSLLHELKYRDKTQAGVSVGMWYGTVLKEMNHPVCKADIILPIPLHAKKKQKRGYNQSDYLAEGLAESLGIEWRSDVLERVTETISQTRKNKYERWENVQNIFRVKRPAAIKGKHVVLVDDVVTTGSTLEVCGKELLSASAGSLSLLTIASARL